MGNYLATPKPVLESWTCESWPDFGATEIAKLMRELDQRLLKTEEALQHNEPKQAALACRFAQLILDKIGSCEVFYDIYDYAYAFKAELARAILRLTESIAEKFDEEGDILEALKLRYKLSEISEMFNIDEMEASAHPLRVDRVLAYLDRRRNPFEDLEGFLRWQLREMKYVRERLPFYAHRLAVDAVELMERWRLLKHAEDRVSVTCELCLHIADHRVLARIFLNAEYDTSRNIVPYCKRALDASDYDCAKALEIWGYALFLDGKYEHAREKLEECLKCLSPEATQERMECEHVLKTIDTLGTADEHVQIAADPDPDWLNGDEWGKQQQRMQEESANKIAKHRQKKKKSGKMKTFDRKFLVDQMAKNVSKEEYQKQEAFHEDIGAEMTAINNGGLGQFRLQQPHITNAGQNVEQRNAVLRSVLGTHAPSVYTSPCRTNKQPKSGSDHQIKDGLMYIFPTDGWYAKSVEILNETKGNIVSEILETRNVEISPEAVNETRSTKKRLYQRLSKPDLERILRSSSENYKLCTIYLQSSQSAKCYSKEKDTTPNCVEITGRTNCGQSFSTDEVVVELHRDTKEGELLPSGKVLGTYRRELKGDHRVLVCQADVKDPSLLRPLCRTVPKFKVLQSTPPNAKGTKDTVKWSYTLYDVECGKLKELKSPNVHCADVHQYMFWVIFLKWDEYSRYPLGAIIRMKALAKLSVSELRDIFDSATVIQHPIPLIYTPETLHATRLLLDRSERRGKRMEGRKDLTSLKVFTIDPKHSQDLDDALSIEAVVGGFKVGVHIADVSAAIPANCDIDKEAQLRGTSHYPSNARCINMLPDPLVTDIFSLLPNKERMCLSLFFRFSESGVLLSKTNPCKTRIRSDQRLSKEEVQDIMSSKCTSSLDNEIKQLHLIARKLRHDRLGDDRGCEEYWEAHSLVEELMLLTNQTVAEFLLQHYPQNTPLRCQYAPLESNVQDIVSQYGFQFTKSVLCNIPFRLPKIDPANAKTKETKRIPIQERVWEDISHQLAEGGKELIATKELHPLHACFLFDWRAIQFPAEYRCSGDGDTRHFTLGLRHYTHFTSPIRRYIDIVVHRLVHAAIDNLHDAPYQQEEIIQACNSANKASEVSKSYQKKQHSVEQKVRLSSKPERYHAVVVRITDEYVTMLNPGSKDQPVDIHFSLLGLSRQPEHDTDNDMVTLTWKRRLYDTSGLPTSAGRPLRGDDKRKTQPLDPARLVVEFDFRTWERLTKLSCDATKIPSDVTPLPRRDYTFSDVSSEERDGVITEQYISFSLTLQKGHLLDVQVSASADSFDFKPAPQLVTISPSVTCCLMHTGNPVGMFSKCARQKSQPRYKSLEGYKEVWVPICDMDVATNIIEAKQNAICIRHVGISVPNHPQGYFELQRTFCEARGIVTPSSTEGEDLKEVFLCLRRTKNYEEASWVGHGRTSSFEERSQKVRFNFVLNHESAPVPQEMLSEEEGECSVEMLEVDPAGLSVMRALDRLTDRDLAGSLAIGQLPDKSEAIEELITLADSKETDKSLEEPTADLTVVKWDITRKTRGKTQIPANNKQQEKAVRRAIHFNFSVIHGPPGTGKTFTAMKILYFYVHLNRLHQKKLGQTCDAPVNRQVMFCGPSNKSVDVVAAYLKNKLRGSCPKIVRVYGRDIEAKDFPLPEGWVAARSSSISECSQNLRDIALHHLIRREDRPFSSDIRRYDDILRRNKFDPAVCEEFRKKYMDLISKANVAELQSTEIILCTTTSSDSKRIRSAARVFQCVVDECGMCTEPETLVPLVSTSAEQVVLIGDHKQLQPIVKCKLAAVMGLQTSLFERWVELLEGEEKWSKRFTRLETQYRMHPSICHMSSSQFYNHLLITTFSQAWSGENNTVPEDFWPGLPGRYQFQTRGNIREFPCHVVFCHVEGQEETLPVTSQEGHERSKSNELECHQTIRIVRLLGKNKIAPKSINVMSQYRAQCHKVKAALKREGLTEVAVNTVVASQGDEWDYVVFSLVRSIPDYLIDPNPSKGWLHHQLGFITDTRQINVGLTRARKGLILIGNKNLLKCDQVFEKLLGDMERRECLVDAENFHPERKPLRLLRAAKVGGCSK